MKKLKLEIQENKIYSLLNQRWLPLTPEEILRQTFILRLIEHYGFSPQQMSQDVQVIDPVKAPHSEAYILIWRTEEELKSLDKAVIVVRCWAEREDIDIEEYLLGLNNTALSNVKFLVAVNEQEVKYFRINQVGEILDIPKAVAIKDEKAIDKFLSPRKIFTRDEFRKLLFKCHTIIRNNDKLSPEAAFDEICKILFMKMWYEKKPEDDPVFSLERYKKREEDYEINIKPSNIEEFGKKADIPYINYIFTKSWENSSKERLFDENETIKLKQTSVEQIIEELEKYNLSNTPDDVKGIAFEEFLGKTFRGELGQFFTPRTIVDFMVDVLAPQEDEFICDPCCGSGGFLIKAFTHIKKKIENHILNATEIETFKFDDPRENKLDPRYGKYRKEEQKNDQLTEINKNHSILTNQLDTKELSSRIHYLARHCIFGTDANPRMARVAKMNMVMHGDGYGGVYHHDGLINTGGIYENRFHVIFTNPPFGARIDKNLKLNTGDLPDKETRKNYESSYRKSYTESQIQAEKNIGKPILDLFDLGKTTRLTEVLFMERCLRLLTPGGRMGIVLPEGVLNSPTLQKAREYFESRARILLVVSLPQDIFISLGATVKSSLVFLKKFDEKEAEEYNHISRTVTEEVKGKYIPTIRNAEAILSEEINRLAKSKNHLSDLKQQLKKETQPDRANLLKIEIQHLAQDIEKQTLAVKKRRLSNSQQAKKISALMEKEIKEKIKEQWDYEIPMAEVQKAGISSTGAPVENQLPDIAKEFTAYRKEHKLWKEKIIETEYWDYDTKSDINEFSICCFKKTNDA